MAHASSENLKTHYFNSVSPIPFKNIKFLQQKCSSFFYRKCPSLGQAVWRCWVRLSNFCDVCQITLVKISQYNCILLYTKRWYVLQDATTIIDLLSHGLYPPPPGPHVTWYPTVKPLDSPRPSLPLYCTTHCTYCTVQRTYNTSILRWGLGRYFMTIVSLRSLLGKKWVSSGWH